VSPISRQKKKLHVAGLIISFVGAIGCSFVWFLSNNNEDFNLGLMPWTGPVAPIHWVILLFPILFFLVSAVMAWKSELTGGVMLILGSLIVGCVLLLKSPLMLVFYGFPALLLLIAGIIFFYSHGRGRRSIINGIIFTIGK